MPGPDSLQTLRGDAKRKYILRCNVYLVKALPNQKDVVKEVLMSSCCFAMTTTRTGSSVRL